MRFELLVFQNARASCRTRSVFTYSALSSFSFLVLFKLFLDNAYPIAFHPLIILELVINHQSSICVTVALLRWQRPGARTQGRDTRVVHYCHHSKIRGSGYYFGLTRKAFGNGTLMSSCHHDLKNFKKASDSEGSQACHVSHLIKNMELASASENYY